MRTLKVTAPGGSYPVHVGSGAWDRHLQRTVRRIRPSRLHLVTEDRVRRSHGKKVLQLLRATGVPVGETVVPPGETSKSSRQLQRIWRDMIRAGCDRQSCVVTLGGGMAGDLGGFAAASILRGIDFLQLPTTLLAMVDASVGGKTGINLPEGKNLVGAFHQPRAVIADLESLKTLSARQFRSGWAEVIKTAAIRDSRLLLDLERNCASLRRRDGPSLVRVIGRCVRIKAKVVEADERESGLRRILNFGHTLAHALESVGRYGGLLHGEAVAVGMSFAARMGEHVGRTPRGTAKRIETLLRKYALPASVPARNAAPLLRAMARDKKRGREGILWVLLSRLGHAETGEIIDDDVVQDQLNRFMKT